MNMSYCRYENTAKALSDCCGAMDELGNPCADTDHGEEDDGRTVLDDLNSYERDGLLTILRLSADILEKADPALLREAGVRLERLAAYT